MKNLNTLLAFLLIALSTTASVPADGSKVDKKSNVPAAPSVWLHPEIEAPESLEVSKIQDVGPVAKFIWGGAPSKLAIVPVAPFVWGEYMDDVPANLSSIYDDVRKVPVSPFTWGEPSELEEFNN